MTERARADTLLDDLLTSSDVDTHSTPTRENRMPTPTSGPVLTERDEMKLMREAYGIGTPTLAPDGRSSADFEPHHTGLNAGSFVGEFTQLVQRYPLQSVLAAAGIGYILTRQRR